MGAPELRTVTAVPDVDVNFLAHAAKQIRLAAEELSADNARAAAEQDKREWQTFIDALAVILRKPGGVANAVGMICNELETLEAEQEEGSMKQRDIELAREILDAAAQGVDLTYGTNAARFQETRQTAIQDMREWLQEVRV